MRFESSGEDAVANVYSYTFEAQLARQGGGAAIPVNGSFSVDYNTLRISNINVTANNFNFISGFVFQSGNPDGSIGYNVQLSYQPFSNDNNFLNFYYNSQQVSSFTGVTYLREFRDNTVFPAQSTFTQAQQGSVPVSVVAVCFVTGDRIRTIRGEVAVEDLQVGDRAVTASGALRPITWIGHRHLDGRGRALPVPQQPIRVRAGAFGSGLPARDLRLSPGHPVLVGADADAAGGHLVPVMCLINGTSIAREPAAAVTYWHVELDSHDILLAEGLPAESYYDMGSRAWFAGEDGALVDPNFVPAGEHGRCRPVAVDGPVVEAERARLSALFAASLGADCAWDEAERFGWLAA